MHLFVFPSLFKQVLMDRSALLVPFFWGSACLGFVKCLSIVLFNRLSVLLHILLILLFRQQQILKSPFLRGLLTDQQRLKSAFLPCLLLKRLLHEQVLLFLLVKAIQIQHVMDAPNPVLPLCSLGLFADLPGLGVNLGDEGEVLDFLGLLLHLLCVDSVVEADFCVDEFVFEGIFV